MNNIISILSIVILMICFVYALQFIIIKISKKTFEYFEIANNNITDNQSIDFIPKIIIQTWKTKNIPEKYHENINSMVKYNKDFEFKFFTDDDINSFLQTYYPKYYQTYISLPILIQKIDFFRYVAVYHYGGFYFDLDMTGLKPIHELTKFNEAIFPIDTHIDSFKKFQPRYERFSNINYLLGQYAFGAPAKHPFILQIIENIQKNLSDTIQKSLTPFGSTHQYIYDSTGPDYVTEQYLSYINTKNAITYPVKILSNPNQFFGDYAQHNHYGTWK